MKTAFTYGLGIALASALLAYIAYFAGLHNDIDQFRTGQLLGSIGGLVIMVAGLFLGLRAFRENAPDQSLSYGRGVGAGALIGLFSGVFSAVSVFVYGAMVNPGFHEMLLEYQLLQLEAKGVPSSQVESMEGMMRFFTGPTWIALMTLVMSPLMATVIALVLAAFLKRKPASQPPPLA